MNWLRAFWSFLRSVFVPHAAVLSVKASASNAPPKDDPQGKPGDAAPPASGTLARRPWTFMVYMAGDNGKVFDTQFGKVRLMASMTEPGYRDLMEMGTVGTTGNVAVTCLFDTTEGTYLVEVRKGQGLSAGVVEPLREVNTGDPDTLRQFIVQSAARYPAQHYALVIWNHGTGWLDTDAYAKVRAENESHRSWGPIFRTTPQVLSASRTRPIAFDDSSKDFLDSADLRKAFGEALAETGVRLDLIGMDACLMAMIEGARELAPYFGYFVASQEIEPIAGWPYGPILAALDARPAASAEGLAKTIVTEYAKSYGGTTRPLTDTAVTQSAVLLTGTAATESLCKALVDAVGAAPTLTLQGLVQQARDESLVFDDRNYRDLGDFAARLAAQTEWSDYPRVAAAAAALRDHLQARDASGPVLQVGYRSGYVRATGMSVYLPASLPASRRSETLAIYRKLAFAEATGWDRMLEWLFDGGWPA